MITYDFCYKTNDQAAPSLKTVADESGECAVYGPPDQKCVRCRRGLTPQHHGTDTDCEAVEALVVANLAWRSEKVDPP